MKSAIRLRRLNGILTLFWIALIPVSFALGWAQLNAFITLLSLIALALGSASGWQASRTEVEQMHAADDVVEAIVDKTELNRLEDREQ